jgi:hypothetical protein
VTVVDSVVSQVLVMLTLSLKLIGPHVAVLDFAEVVLPGPPLIVAVTTSVPPLLLVVIVAE